MLRKKRSTLLQLPAQASKDLNTAKGLLDRWTVGIEDVLKDTLTWVKKHKFLVLLGIGLFAFYRYWLVEPEQNEDEDGDYE